MSIDMSPAAITARLRCASDLVRDLSPERRLDTKLDMSPAAITARLREAAALLELCRKLQK
jgi:lambda repressor-like predicted transcriptional regulator